MSRILPLLDNVIENLKKLTETVVIKYSNLANLDETLEKTKAFDYFYLASNKLDTFETYPHYTEEALILAGVLDPIKLKEFMNDKNLIPTSIRRMVLEAQRFIVVRDFEEQNNYYRTFIGLPQRDDTEFFYVDEFNSEQFDIPMDVPIHKLSRLEISKLQGSGFIKRLIKERPDKTYLQYLGKNALDLYTLRHANNFAIIDITKQLVPDKLFRDFMIAYEQCREYFMVSIYIKEFASMHKYYDNIIGFVIMVSSIRSVMTNIFKNGIDRDFYDIPSIVKMFEAYRIPFIQEYTLEQHRTVLRNINNLIRIKSTDRVLIELCELLGFDDVSIYKYYLTKSHKQDEQGRPIFKYKDHPVRGKVLDKEKMYNIGFSRVELREKNIGAAVTNSKNKLDYTKVTDGDPYWWEDEDLKNAIYENEFNYIETKYLSFEIIYKMSKVIFESIYLLSMLHDRKKDTDRIQIFLSKIDSKPIDLFDACILLFALTAKKHGLKGEIIHDPSKIGYVLGFNFKIDLAPIIEMITNDPDLNDPVLINFISDMSINSFDDIDRLYGNIKGFKYYIQDKLYYATDKELYYKYKTIYKTLMTTEYMGELFQLPDGDIASTYKEYLMYTNYDLYEIVEATPKESINELILHILTKIEEQLENANYIHQTADGFNINAMALLTLVNFFKSYTVDVEQFNIIYLIDDRMDNLIKFIDDPTIHVTNTLIDNMLDYDVVNYTTNIHGDSKFKFMCRTQLHVYLRLDDHYVFLNMMEDKISQMDVQIWLDDKFVPIGTISKLDMVLSHNETLNLEELYKYFISIFHRDDIEYKDSFEIHTKITHAEYLKLMEREDIFVTIQLNEQLNTKDDYYTIIIIKHLENLNLINKIKQLISLYLDADNVNMIDIVPHLDLYIKHPEILNLDDSGFKYVISNHARSDIKFNDIVIYDRVVNIVSLLNEKDKLGAVINIRGLSDKVTQTDDCTHTTVLTPQTFISFIHDLSASLDMNIDDITFKPYDTYLMDTTYKEGSFLPMRDDLKIVYN